ncbi:MAG: nitroreductase family protein [Candidatus Micrarchaeota archaeon]
MTSEMDFLSLATKRKTVFEFDKQMPSEAAIRSILDAGRWAPSSLNLQPWSFIIVKKPEVISKIMEICRYGFFHNDPPVIIAIVSEPRYEKHKGIIRGKMKELTEYHKYLDASMPALSMLFEATSLGIGSCLLSPFQKKANRILGVPKGKSVFLLVGLGFEKKRAFRRDRERNSLSSIVFREKYGRKD